MKRSGKAILSACVLLTAACYFWNLRPVNIIGVHYKNDFSYVIVDHLPFTDRAKVKWWLDHQDEFREKYHIPAPSASGNFDVSVWAAGKGYLNYEKNYKQDLLCFSDMESKDNCIEKNLLLTIKKIPEQRIYFVIGFHDSVYELDNDNGLIRVQ
ncbi:DUF943 family protein [Erwiniaceae bacterium BAC15a-03b]|uniref:DUF943 family protein n=1 Tax=Winslowiella arboricola TaxID=2978220 RepID=A0A9J6PQK5_9GAMM|nr:DUF943 family protein [Winslowiella arboricola]MCU5774649.1 DUF943 family protein [Winslowiella arboricola]MCU5777941.1 DUF943 family protein [Winslowiella arboricola]